MIDTINEIQDELDTFLDRKKDLRNIKRYSIYDVMFYRSNLYIHSKRVAFHVCESMKYIEKAYPEFDKVKALIIALVHDDAEIITGDFQAADKAIMKEEELENIERLEEKAIKVLVKKYPKKIYGYDYNEILTDVLEVNSIEAVVVKLLDKFDGFGEALHEIFAGNKYYMTTTKTKNGVPPTPYDYYINLIPNYYKIFPRLKPLFNVKNFPLKNLQTINQFKVIENGKPHTKESIMNKTGYYPYDLWLSVNLKYSNEEEIKDLYIKKE
jgi:5'-deoxynucleotidase YfbR-like HD superfamily hydrolase